jgi:signal transduction histidine kinase
MRTLLTLAVLALLAPASVHAEGFATSKDAELMVHQAIAYMKKEGKQKALAEFSDPDGRFRYKDLYLMAYDLEGRCLAHGTRKERIGKIHLDEKDGDGRSFIRERIEIARKYGKGWQEYKYANPMTNRIEQKVAYIEASDGVVVICGAYKK